MIVKEMSVSFMLYLRHSKRYSVKSSERFSDSTMGH
jgi:hypothetical protein